MPYVTTHSVWANWITKYIPKRNRLMKWKYRKGRKHVILIVVMCRTLWTYYIYVIRWLVLIHLFMRTEQPQNETFFTIELCVCMICINKCMCLCKWINEIVDIEGCLFHFRQHNFRVTLLFQLSTCELDESLHASHISPIMLCFI